MSRAAVRCILERRAGAVWRSKPLRHAYVVKPRFDLDTILVAEAAFVGGTGIPLDRIPYEFFGPADELLAA